MGDGVGERRRRRRLERAREQATVAPDVTVAAPASDDVAPGDGSRADGVPASDGAAPGVPRPVSRRDLRDRDRRPGARTAPRAGRPGVPAQRDGASAGAAAAPLTGHAPAAADPPGAPGTPATTIAPAAPAAAATPAVATPAGEPEATAPRPPSQDPERAPESHRYTWWHLLALAAVAGVLAFLIWSLTTGAADRGATSAARPATLSLPVSPAAPLGEL